MARGKIVWIDDDSDIMDGLFERFEQLGYEFTVFTTYREAMENLDVIRNCDLIFLDLILPSGDFSPVVDPSREENKHLGLDLLRTWRSEEVAIWVPVLVLSIIAYEASADERELAELNAKPLHKDASLEQIHRTVERMLTADRRGAPVSSE
jgi:CheY-like chemotaxis protein